MSLVPYSSRDSREIVLRYDDAIVVRDPQSKQLILRGTPKAKNPLNECPYCHRPLPTKAPEHDPRPSNRQESFVSPEYFRMLHLAADGSDDEQNPPSSPIRRLVQPAFPNARNVSGADTVAGAEFVTSQPAEPEFAEGQGIKRDAFSPNYFKRFFIEEKELGRGGKGVVLLVKHQLDGVFLGHFACKRVPVGDDHAWLEKVLIEVQLLQHLSHPNLVSYRHVWLEDVKLNRFGPSVPCAFILQQYCNSGDLLHYVIGSGVNPVSSNERLKAQMRRRSKGQMEPPIDLTKPAQRKLAFDEIYSFFKDISSGLAHLHAANYIHRDLKPSNCLLHKTGTEFKCLISDFGEVQAENIVRKSTGATGTISYCAPEVLRQDATGRYGNFTTKSDIFSLGMILYFMCFGRLPYSSAENIQEEFEDLDQLRAEISTWSGFRDERQERPDLPDQLYEFLRRLLSIDPAGRPSASEILHAISTESGLDSPPRVGRSSSGGGNLGIGKRIQAIDSPIPGTPVEGSRHSRQPPLLEHYAEETTSIQDSVATTPLLEDPPDDLIRGKDHLGSLQTPLLMPPPSTALSTMKTRIINYSYHLSHQLPLSKWIMLKVVSFIIKLYLLIKPCLPLATNPAAMYSLLLLAALELAFSTERQLKWTLLSLAAHFVITTIIDRHDQLCMGATRQWEWAVE